MVHIADVDTKGITPISRKQAPLTERQAEVLGVIRRLYAASRIAPSLVELADELNVGRSVARNFLLVLDRKGFIRRQPGKYRAFVLVARRTGRQ